MSLCYVSLLLTQRKIVNLLQLAGACEMLSEQFDRLTSSSFLSLF